MKWPDMIQIFAGQYGVSYTDDDDVKVMQLMRRIVG